MRRVITSFVRDQRGAAMPEYALLLFGVLLLGASAMKQIGPRVSFAGDATRRVLSGEDVQLAGNNPGTAAAIGGMFVGASGSGTSGSSSGSSGSASSSGASSGSGGAASVGGSGSFANASILSFSGSPSAGSSSGGTTGGGGSSGSSGGASGGGGGGSSVASNAASSSGGILNGGGVVLGATGSQPASGGSRSGGSSGGGGSSSGGSSSAALASSGGSAADASSAGSSSGAGSAVASNQSGAGSTTPLGFLGGTGANTVNPGPSSTSSDGATQGNGYTISAQGEKEMQALLAQAKANADGKRPLGHCYHVVKEDIDEVGYGNIAKTGNTAFPKQIPGADQEYAHQFADYMNATAANGQTNASNLGLQKLPITNPYDAPPGSIIVVRAGTPGTHNPIAGDIVVAGGNGKFYNDGNMGYGGSKNFPAGNNYVLGIYAPK